jgi:polar amino acid transport system permease protein
MDWDWNYVVDVYPRLLEGLQLTVIATALIFAVSVVLGLVIAILRRSSVRAISWTTYWVSEFIRRTPELVQLYFVFYVLPEYGVTLDALTAGVLALGVHYSTYAAEIYRGGIEAVPRGQWNAATALALPRWRVWRTIILPQAFPRFLPALGNLLILMFKQTALLAAITVQELLAVAQQIGSETFDYVEPLILTGFFYFVVSYVASFGIRALERRVETV